MLRKLCWLALANASVLMMVVANAAAAAPAPATLIVEVPEDAQLLFFGTPSKLTGAVRKYEVKDLVPGKKYSYELRAQAMRDGILLAQAQRVTVAAGETTRVQLTNLQATREANKIAGGYVYTINNDFEKNAVVVLRHKSDGSLEEVPGSPFDAQGRGLAGGDIDEQGAIRVQGNYVLAANPGSDTIAVFRKMEGGKLEHVSGSPFASGGNAPLSLTMYGDLVYVANQAPAWASPTTKPNLVGFRMDERGKLTRIAKAMTEFPEGKGPAQVEFSPMGKTLAVTAGFQNEPDSRIYSYMVQSDGTLKAGQGSPATPEGASGVVGFSWAKTSERVFVSNFRGSAVTVFNIDPKTAAIEQLGEAMGDDQTAACWTAISADGRMLYVGNFVSNSISAFSVEGDGRLKLMGSVKRRGVSSADTKDIELSRDGKFLYAVGSGQRQISIFRIGNDGMPVELPEGRSPLALRHGQNITGLTTD